MSEFIITSGFIDPATFDLVWTMAMAAMLLLAGTLSAYILPWSDAEIDATYNSIHNSVRALKPSTINAPAHAVTR